MEKIGSPPAAAISGVTRSFTKALTTAPKHSAAFVASFAGDDQNATATSDPDHVVVAPRVTIAAPSHSAASRRLVVTGTVSPDKSGRTVHLVAVSSKGARKDLGTTTLTGSSSYRFAVKLGKGTWTLTVNIGASPGNAAGRSKPLKVRRT